MGMQVLRNTLYIWVAICFTTLISCDKSPSSQQTETAANQALPDDQKPVMTFKEPVYQFGTVDEGAEISHAFSFVNTGKTDLLISNAIASCGCTVPEWPKEPIAPGDSGKIMATFNTEGKQGQQHKAITITANTKDKVEVALEGEVRAKPEAKK